MTGVIRPSISPRDARIKYEEIDPLMTFDYTRATGHLKVKVQVTDACAPVSRLVRFTLADGTNVISTRSALGGQQSTPCA